MSYKANDRMLLYIAAQVGSEKIIAILLDHGADVNDTHNKIGYMLLHIVKAGGYENIVKLLLSRDADWTLKDTQLRKYTPLRQETRTTTIAY